MKDQIMLKSFLSVTLLFLGIAMSSAASYPPTDNWDFLGTKNIGHHLDRDVIHVRSSRTLYASIEVRTDRPNVNLHKCVIHFRDGGDKQRVNLKKDRRGGETHLIELYGGARAIDKIEIIGSRDYSKILRVFDKGTVEIWGQLARNSSYNNDDYDRYDYPQDDYYAQDDYYTQERNRLAQERTQREQARLEQERIQVQRARAQLERERRRQERARRDRERTRRSGGVCPPRGRW